MNKKGLIFDIQKFSIHDGPGIRTTIFFKGCSLRCAWCHNPESICPQQQLSYNPKKCQLCGTCVKYVNSKGINIKNNQLNIDFSIHNNSFQLVNICPFKAYEILGKEYTSNEIIDIILKDKEYYDNSNGGVTFSGGEALNQIDFICELGHKLKALNINICLDISGYDTNNFIDKTFDFVDIYLLDFKIFNSKLQKKYINKNFKIDDLLNKFEKNKKKVILRCPIIPNINNTTEHFQKIEEYIIKYSCIKDINLLPYHNLRKNKKFLSFIKIQDFNLFTEEEKTNLKKLEKHLVTLIK
ncbi:glycyl-radical enzyme activating protein [Fusobacterium sp.]|uniref:glycyl-radical enzyme activating protein n=1 Tax=Fusobacterium sp. TaxID=68766 RepID=UPI0025BE5690|nr:glycyl-radical enzyme activating protein [Fusobacterium sp.]